MCTSKEITYPKIPIYFCLGFLIVRMALKISSLLTCIFEKNPLGGMPSPGTLTCGAVESCSVKDYVKRGDQTYVELIKTAARGLEEELGIELKGKDREAICLTTVYLKYDNHEWGMCGFVDLSDERIAPERRLTFDSIASRFTAADCKDKFEHDRFVAVPLELHKMAHFVRENFHDFASSGKLVVVKVMQSFFGVSEVEKIFKALDSSG